MGNPASVPVDGLHQLQRARRPETSLDDIHALIFGYERPGNSQMFSDVLPVHSVIVQVGFRNRSGAMS